MKGIVKLIVIASTAMLVALMGVMLYLNQVKEQQSEGEIKEAQKELDMILEDDMFGEKTWEKADRKKEKCNDI